MEARWDYPIPWCSQDGNDASEQRFAFPFSKVTIGGLQKAKKGRCHVNPGTACGKLGKSFFF